MNERRLIINADDLGLSRGITDGILLTHRLGLVTSTSLMVNQPATDYAVGQLQSTPHFGVGIHLNLCQGTPVLPPESVPTLVTEKGQFYSPGEMSGRLLNWQVSAKEVESEFRAQIRRMKSYSLSPTHADSHHRLHLYPAAALPFYKAVTAEGIRRARAPRKRYWPTQGRLGAPHIGALHRRLAAKAYLEIMQSVIFRNLILPDAGVAFPPRSNGKIDLLRETWKLTIESLPPGTYEMWCHPGFREAGFSETDRLASQRELEIAILTDPQLRGSVESRGIQLITFNALTH